jgi:uncharacterized membrane protein
MIHDIEVDVPVRTAYNQWTQFEDLPLFMDHVESVQQLTEDTVRWKVKIAGVSREWDARITEQTPDQRIAWAALDGTQNAGVVTFHALSDDRTRVVLQLDMDPHGLLEQIADKGGFVRDRAKKDLVDFKEFIEKRGRETGAYRKTIDREAGIVDEGATGGDPTRADADDAIDLRDDPQRQDEFAQEQTFTLRPDEPPVARRPG